ncbi:MAG: ribosome maturation factor RimP [Clostridiales bacterium]|nr:ribosome maturation factor RimP [Clostridiales bacterium]
MTKKSDRIDRVAQVAGQLAAEMGYEMVDAELATEGAGRFLRFYINREGGVTLDDLEAYHRRIQPLMDDIDYDYMEVSSPGADRPLKKPDDFRRAEGMPVEVRLYRPIDGAKRFEGVLVGLRGDDVVLRAGEREIAVPLKQTAKVSLVPPPIDDEA